MERRSFTRIPFKTKAVVRFNDQTTTGEVENLSLNGMFLRTSERIDVDEIVTLEVLIWGTSSQLSILLHGTVLRHNDEGIAIQFKEIDLDSFFHLKNLISYNTGDMDKVMSEFHEYVDKACEYDTNVDSDPNKTIGDSSPG